MAQGTAASSATILVSGRQKGNPLLVQIRSIPWEYSDIVPDYVLGPSTCALFLSLKYHQIHPEYIYTRIQQLGKSYKLRVLLCLVDIESHQKALVELSKTSVVNDLTLICAWSPGEAARYLESYKSLQNAPHSLIKAPQISPSFMDSVVTAVTSVRSVSKSDAYSLISTFGSIRSAFEASHEQLVQVPRWGDVKAKYWEDAVGSFLVEPVESRLTPLVLKDTPRDLDKTTDQLVGEDIEPINSSEHNSAFDEALAKLRNSTG